MKTSDLTQVTNTSQLNKYSKAQLTWIPQLQKVFISLVIIAAKIGRLYCTVKIMLEFETPFGPTTAFYFHFILLRILLEIPVVAIAAEFFVFL